MYITMTYRGITSTTKEVEVLDIKRDVGPPADDVTMGIPGMQGTYPIRQDDRGKTISVQLLVKTADATTLRAKVHDVADWLKAVKDDMNRPLPSALVFSDDTAKQWMAYPIGIKPSVDIIGLACEFQVQFFCPSPYAEALTEKDVGASSTNGGTEPAPPEITVTVTDPAGITDLKVELDGTSKFLFLEGSFAKDTVIVFDKATRMVTVDAVDAREDLHHTRRWFDLPSGAFTITTTPASGITVAVKFRERWR